MFRSIIACLLVAGTTAGCAHLQASTANGYCIVGSAGSCPELEGNGDCQRCPSARQTIDLTGR
jgi:hypothetical protein